MTAPVLRVVPTLADLVVDPALVANLSPDEAASALVALTALQAALAFRVNASRTTAKPDTPAAGDRLLTAAEAAERAGVTPRWLRGRRLPFIVRVSPRCVRYSEAGLEKWMRRRVQDEQRKWGLA